MEIPHQRHRYNGATYVPEMDNVRLDSQMGRVWTIMRTGTWHTLQEISKLTDDPAASISAQLRHLRKPRFGSHTVEKRSRGNRKTGLYEYRVVLTQKQQSDLFTSTDYRRASQGE